MDQDERKRLIGQYGDGTSILTKAWSETPEDARHWKPSADSWSAHEIVIHCADSESYAAIRIRILAAEPEPLIVGYDQERWASSFRYDQLPADLALATVHAVRANTHHFIRQLDDAAWAAVGTHTESGRYSAEDWLRIYAVHLHDHAAQIRSNVERWQRRT